MPLKERLREFFRTTDVKIFFGIWVSVLIYYASLIRVQFTFGDGPELLTAMYRLGGPHPSGYPLFTLLGFIPARIGIPSPWWLASFCTAALPGALAAGFLYLLLRETRVMRPVAVLGALSYALNTHIVYQATRVEVYALHCFLGAVALWSIAVFLRIGEKKYAYIATLFTCLALANHLTSAFLIVPITLGMLMGNRQEILKVKTVLTLLGIALLCSLIYLYLPIQAMLNTGDRISWNDPQTLERFWFHVSGKEYSIFRRYDKIPATLNKFHVSLNNTFFPGILVVCALGLFDIFLKRWKFLVVVFLFSLTTMGYVATYPINDISTYYSLIFFIAIFLFGNGASWLVSVRFKSEDSKKLLILRVVAIAISVGWVIGLGFMSRKNGYKEAVAQEMSESIMRDIQDPAIIFTTVDGHTFPMWYQAYVEHPDRKVIPIDAVMFKLKNKQWYRDFFFDNFPDVKWPSNKMAKTGKWKQWMIDNNPDVNFYALMDTPWKGKGSWAENRGWHVRLNRGKPVKSSDATKYAKHIYIAREKVFGSSKYFYDTNRVYEKGEGKIACVAEWTKHPGISADWEIRGPNGEFFEFKNHKIPKGSNQSWEYLKPEQQTVGTWTCEVSSKGEKTIKTSFKIE